MRSGASPGNRSPQQDDSWGWRLLVPGWAQWSWRQPERAAFFFGSYLAAASVALFAWGTPAGFAILAAAFGVHVAAAADAIGQWTFPGFGKLVPLASAGVGLGLGCYAPAVILASIIAWPCQPEASPGEGFLINRWAYQHRHPAAGDWICYDLPEGGGRGIGRLMAEEGTPVEWSDHALQVAGIPQDWLPLPHAQTPTETAFLVPRDQFLVAPLRQRIEDATLLGLVLVDRDGIQGRAWARHAPVWNRKLLP
jgi:hypothetical protein